MLQYPVLHLSEPQDGGVCSFSQTLGLVSHCKQIEGETVSAVQSEQVDPFSCSPKNVGQDKHSLDAVPEHVRHESWHLTHVAGYVEMSRLAILWVQQTPAEYVWPTGHPYPETLLHHPKASDFRHPGRTKSTHLFPSAEVRY